MDNIDDTTSEQDTVNLGGDLKPKPDDATDKTQPGETVDTDHADSREENKETSEKKKKWIIYPVAALMLAVVGVAVFFGVRAALTAPEKSQVPAATALVSPDSVSKQTLPKPAQNTMEFKPFLIPFPENSDKAFMYLNVFIQAVDKKSCALIKENKTLCRGIIYGILKKELAKKGRNAESSDDIKDVLIKELQAVVLNAGIKIKRIYFANSYSV